jgi:Uma2 family endonuclease
VFLVIEVADSSLDYDRGEKADLYATAGIKDYWFVNLIDRCVEVFRDPQRGRYRSLQVFQMGAKLHPVAFLKITLAAASLFSA